MSQGSKVALVIGCSYKDNTQGIPVLNGTIDDAQNMVNLLLKFGYNVTFMNDNNVKSSSLYPTRANIQNTFATLLQNTQSGDDVVIFYAGHGTQILSSIMKIGDKLIDTSQYNSDGEDEAIVPVDVAYNAQKQLNKDTLIIDETFRYWLQQYGKKGVRIFLMFDCCHSGTMCDLQYSYSCPDNIADIGVPCNTISVNDIKTKLAKEETVGVPDDSKILATVITLSACKDSEVSWEEYVQWGDLAGKESQGLLTSSFIYNVQTGTNATKDIFKLLYCIAMQTSNHKPLGQHPKVTSSIPLHDPVNDTNRYILTGASLFTNTPQPSQGSVTPVVNPVTPTPSSAANVIPIGSVPVSVPVPVKPVINQENTIPTRSKVIPNTNIVLYPKPTSSNNQLLGFGMSSFTPPAKMPHVVSVTKPFQKPIRFASISQIAMTKNLV